MSLDFWGAVPPPPVPGVARPPVPVAPAPQPAAGVEAQPARPPWPALDAPAEPAAPAWPAWPAVRRADAPDGSDEEGSSWEDLLAELDEIMPVDADARDDPSRDEEPAERRARKRPPRMTARRVIAELMLTAGLVVGLYVTWLLVWTDVVAERSQAQAVAELGWAQRHAPDAAVDTSPRTGPAPTLDEPGQGATFAVLRVPRWGAGYERPISQGVDKKQVLDVLGIGHYPGSAMPGDVGNFAIAGHRTTYGKPFNLVQELQVGDALIVQTAQAWYVYRVSSTEIVSPSDVDVIAPTPDQPDVQPTVRSITLTTCHPMYSAGQRFVVHGVLESWLPADAGHPTALDGGA